MATVDLRDLTDDELERMIWPNPPELPHLSQQERRALLRPVLEAMVEKPPSGNGHDGQDRQ
jgi:hypothetical protein